MLIPIKSPNQINRFFQSFNVLRYYVAGLLLVLITSACARADISDDYGEVTAGLANQSLNTQGTPGSIAMHGKATFPVILGSGTYQYAVGAAGRYNDSYDLAAARSVAFAHTGWTSTSGNYGILLENAVKWVSKKTTLADVKIITGPDINVSSYFSGRVASVTSFSASNLTAANLAAGNVLILNMHSDYPESVMQAIKDYAADGGGLIITSTPWALSATRLANSNALLLPFGMTFAGSIPSDSAFTVSATSYSPYYSALNGVKDLIKDKEQILTMTSANKLIAANAIRQVISVNTGITELNANLDTLGDTSHYGWINIKPTATLSPANKPVEAMLARYQSSKFDTLAPEDLFIHPSTSGYPGLPTEGSPVTRTVSINGTTSSNLYINRHAKPVRFETGLYAAPGTTITITIPADKTSAGMMVHIGGSEDNSFSLATWKNFPKIWRRVNLTEATTQTGHVFGGLVTILVPAGSNLGTFDVTVSGALAAPAFILGETTDTEWNNTVKNNPGAFGYIQTDKLVIYLPRNQLVALNNPTEVATHWKTVMDTSDEIFGYTQWRRRGEAMSANLQVYAGAAYADYPIELGWGYSSETELNSTLKNGNWGTYHELGHTYQYNFDQAFVITNSVEVDVNLNCGLLFALVHGRTPWTGSTHSTYDGGKRLTARTAFMALPDASRTWSKAQGDATAYDFYFNLSESFGWDVYKRFFTRLMNYLQNQTSATDPELHTITTAGGTNMKRDRFYLLMCDAAGRNLDAYFQSYGLGVTGKGAEISASVKSMVAAKGYPAWNGNTPIDSISDPGILNINEDIASGTVIYQFSAIDADEPGTIIDYSITAGNEDRAFDIDSKTGELSVNALNDEVCSSYILTVMAQDNGVPRQSISRTFTVNVVNVPKPSQVQSTTFTTNPVQAANTPIGTVSVSMENGITPTNLAIIGGNSGDLFAINPTTGAITVKHPEKLPINSVIELTIQVLDSDGHTSSAPVFIISGTQTGLKVERWNNSTAIGGTPSYIERVSSFELETIIGSILTRRFSGYLIPPQTGHYTFWISSDDKSTLYLSSSADPAGKTNIASVPTYTNARIYDTFASQKSTTILLQGGHPYYIEAEHYGNTNREHISVAWVGPGIVRQIIPGSALLPNLDDLTFLPGTPSTPVITIIRPATNTFVSPTGKLWCKAVLTDDAQPAPANVQWNMISGPGTVTFSAFNSLETEASFSTPGTYLLRCVANDTVDSGQDQVYIHVGRPSFLHNSTDIGTVDCLGETSATNGTYVLHGGGDDNVTAVDQTTSKVKDANHYAWQFLRGNGSITARLADFTYNTQYTAYLKSYRTGVVIRNTLDPLAASAGTVYQADGLCRMQYRLSDNDVLARDGDIPQAALPVWLRVTREGNVFTSYTSSNGIDWISIGSQTVAMPEMTTVGLIVSGRSLNGIVPTATFDNVSIDFSGNTAPLVSAGADQAISGSQVTLTGVATDDGPPATLTHAWSQIAGPVPTAITSATSLSPVVTFSQAGVYTFRLITDDGAAAGTNTVNITVGGAAPGSYAEWQAAYVWESAEDSLPNTDPDHDGIDNLSEYAFGGHPLRNQTEEH
ncbi:MAG: M60 family metallopeptidase, partial [Puniceicoccales bacterium]|nr:M60 family metallopeptidase [Puniceicoccales bacterium]